MYKGIDLLALSMMDPHMVSKAMKPGCSFGFLMGTFGDAIPNATYLLEHNHPPACRVHLSNGPCARNRNCGEGEIRPGQFGKLGERAVKINLLAIRYPKTKFYISPRVEHDEDLSFASRWLGILKLQAPHCTPVLSCGPKGSWCKGYLKEDHANLELGHYGAATGDIISNDGESIFEAPYNWTSGATTMVLAWDYCCNFRMKGEDIFVPPRERPIDLGPTHNILIRMQEAIGL